MFPFIVAHSKYRENTKMKIVAINPTPASTNAVKKLFKKG